MRSYEERAKYFIQQIFPYIEESIFDVYAMSDRVEEFNAANHRNVQFRHGIARIALITSDYVVKYDYDSYEVGYVGGCEQEVKLYAIAKQEGFDYLFAKITRYSYKGYNFYIMPRIRGINESNWNHADYYMTQKEVDWCDAHNLSDLHCNNYGFRNGKLCIVDYACTLTPSDRYDSSSSSSSSSSY